MTAADRVLKTVLFVCIHNSARSQMAEAFVNARYGDEFRAYSAGLESGSLNPVVVAAMKEVGIDIGGNATKTVSDPQIRARDYDYVVTVCDEASAEACPIYPTSGERLHWGFPDPSSFEGAFDDRVARTEVVRDAIAQRVDEWQRELRQVLRDP
jgi:arsenate reductase